MKYISLFIILLLAACSGSNKDQNNTGTNDSLANNNTAILAADQPILEIHNLTDRLPELMIPAAIEIDSIHPEWIELSKNEMDAWIPEDFFENKECRVFAMNKFTQDACMGVLYTIEFPEGDPDAYDETRHKAVLILYDNHSRWAGDLILAVEDYGTGRAKIKSKKEIMYMFSSEMEFIQLTQTTYALEGSTFKEIATKELTFDSSEEGNEAYEAYVKKVFK